MDALFNAKINTLRTLLRSSNHAVVFTGAGISTPSGIPDFRTPQKGLWTKNNPMEVAALSVFKRHPQRFFDWLHPLLVQSTNAKPNLAHEVIADLQNKGIIKAVITQNIDMLHQHAGSTNVIAVHGTLGSYTCLTCSHKVQEDDHLIIDFVQNKNLPICPQCGAFLKPDVILFEEGLPMHAWQAAQEEAYQTDLLMVVGSSLEVFPANQIPGIAFHNQAKLVINTFSTTPMDQSAHLLLPYDVTHVWAAIADLER